MMINMDKNFKLGKLAVKKDKRNFQFKKLLILNNLPPLPLTFDVDTSLNTKINNYMYLNDKYGCCVIAGRAHVTLRFEKFEQDILIPITDEEVKTSYFYESNGKDSGLIMLDSLDIWRKEGWVAGGKPYNIYAFAQITPKHHEDVKYGIYLLRGILCGLGLPVSAKNQNIWDVVSGKEGDFGSWGGHCVYIVGYNEVGPICVTWGTRKQMTWNFWDTYCDEAYAIIDNRNIFSDSATNPLDCEKLAQLLSQVTDAPISPINPNPPNPSPTPPIPWYDGIVKLFQGIWQQIIKVFNK
jgi:hypothetical protein